MRYFAEISYKGTDFSGWQRQPNANSIQQELEEAFSKLLKSQIQVTGCGRTDAGVHASQYILHVDLEEISDIKSLVYRINKILPASIAIHRIVAVNNDSHARYNANFRKYHYRMTGEKDPFSRDLLYYYPMFQKLDFDLLNLAAVEILKFDSFFPFCKSNSGVANYKCTLYESAWEIDIENKNATYFIAGNRFLRGMVRLIVGMCINVATGKIELEEVSKALQEQRLLSRSLTVPPQGLYLSEIRYPFPLV